MAKLVRGCLCEGQLLLFYSYDTERERGREGKSQERDTPHTHTPRSHGRVLQIHQKCPESPLWSFHPPDHYFSMPARSKRNIHLARKEKMFLSVVPLPTPRGALFYEAGVWWVKHVHPSLPQGPLRTPEGQQPWWLSHR